MCVLIGPIFLFSCTEVLEAFALWLTKAVSQNYTTQLNLNLGLTFIKVLLTLLALSDPASADKKKMSTN